MTTNDPPADESTAVEPRTRRAVTEYITVLPDLGEVAGAPGLFKIVSHSGKTYTVDVFEGRCSCPDSRHNLSDGELCKHAQRYEIATGKAPVPLGVDRDDVDPQLGIHAPGTVRLPATDGGAEIVDAGDDAEILDDDDRPDDCDCAPFLADDGLPCWPCYREGFEDPTPDVDGEDSPP